MPDPTPIDTTATRQFVARGLDALGWGIRALRGQAQEQAAALEAAQSSAQKAVSVANDALKAIEVQIERNRTYMVVQESSLAQLQEAIRMAGGPPE